MKIWCLFSVDNEYDQPENNLVAWWRNEPNFETVLDAIGGSLQKEASILAAANIMQGQTARLDDVDYRLEEVTEGFVHR